MICLRLIFLLGPLFSNTQNDSIITLKVQQLMIKAGEKKTIRIGITVKEGFHIQANKLKDISLVPATLTTDSADCVIPGKPKYPAPKKFKLEGTNDFLDVYDGYMEIVMTIKTNKKIKPGTCNLNGALHYQACDSKRCFFPRSLKFVIPIMVLD